MNSLVLPWVNAETMSLFLAAVAERHADEFIVMVMDQASWHIAGDLVVPDNMRLPYLPRTQKLTGFDWMTSISLNAVHYERSPTLISGRSLPLQSQGRLALKGDGDPSIPCGRSSP